tara:strand:+ start:195 stop:425 length:231 start_codon:yes stop_codon:yes gene_type:complete
MHPKSIDRVIAIPPNLDFPADNPCLLSTSRPKDDFENNASNENAIRPFRPVRRMVIKERNITVESNFLYRDKLFMD